MGQGIRREIGQGAEQGVKVATSALGRLNEAINNVTRSLTGALSIITSLGIASAQSVKRLDASFRLLAGSEEDALRYMEEIKDLAEKANQPFLELQQSATAFLPAARENNLELSKTVLLAQRLLLKDPTAAARDARIAMSELFEGQVKSIQSRFGINDAALKQAVSAGDTKAAVEALDAYLNNLGITEDALFEMGETGINTFAILRDEGTQTLADFFEPFLNDFVLPLTQGLGDMLRELREVNPELKKFVGIAAGLAGTAALANRGIPLIGAVPGGATAGRAVGVGAAAYGGAQLGTFATRQLADAGVGGGFERFE
jgi:hypothetical protein